jgi:hypothetical protein
MHAVEPARILAVASSVASSSLRIICICIWGLLAASARGAPSYKPLQRRYVDQDKHKATNIRDAPCLALPCAADVTSPQQQKTKTYKTWAKVRSEGSGGLVVIELCSQRSNDHQREAEGTRVAGLEYVISRGKFVAQN